MPAIDGATYLNAELSKFLNYNGQSDANTTPLTIDTLLNTYAASPNASLANLSSAVSSYFAAFNPTTISYNSTNTKNAMIPSIRLATFPGKQLNYVVQYYYNQTQQFVDVRYADLTAQGNEDINYIEDIFNSSNPSTLLDVCTYNKDYTQLYIHKLYTSTNTDNLTSGTLLTFSVFLKPIGLTTTILAPYNIQAFIYSITQNANTYVIGNAEPGSQIKLYIQNAYPTPNNYYVSSGKYEGIICTVNKDGSFTATISDTPPGNLDYEEKPVHLSAVLNTTETSLIKFDTFNFNTIFFDNNAQSSITNGAGFAYQLSEALTDSYDNIKASPPVLSYILYGVTTSPRWSLPSGKL
jgi:hypothetical protein